jgi:ribosomal protein S18 acetylase RimI-like enzyme
MLRHVLDHARGLGIRFASVEVDLDDVHIPARRAYQAVGFDRHHHIAIYHQNLEGRNPGSVLTAEEK